MNAAPELLKAAVQGDEQACEQMLRENSGLIWSIVRRYYGRGVEPDDLYQLGCLGFIKAIKGFNFAFGTQFSTYAVPKIAGEIRRFLRDDGAIKVSRSMRVSRRRRSSPRAKSSKIHSGANRRSPSFRRRRDSMPRRLRSVSWRSLRRTACSAKRATA